MTVREAQARIDSREFAEWMAYEDVEPDSPARRDYRAGIVAAAVANAHFPRKTGPPWSWGDWFFDTEPGRAAASVKPSPVRQTQAEIAARLRLWAKAAGKG